MRKNKKNKIKTKRYHTFPKSPLLKGGKYFSGKILKACHKRWYWCGLGTWNGLREAFHFCLHVSPPLPSPPSHRAPPFFSGSRVPTRCLKEFSWNLCPQHFYLHFIGHNFVMCPQLAARDSEEFSLYSKKAIWPAKKSEVPFPRKKRMMDIGISNN